MPGQAAKTLFQDYVAIWQSGHLGDLEQVLHADYVGHPTTGTRNRDGLRERILAFREMYPDVKFHIEDQISEMDRVASRLTATATRNTDGVKVTLYGLNISRISGERIIEEWMTWEVQSN